MHYLDHDFVQVSKLSKDQKKGLSKKWNTFFPRIQVDIHTQMHTSDQSQIIEGDAYVDPTQTIRGDTVKLLGDISPPRFWHPWLCIYYCCIHR